MPTRHKASPIKPGPKAKASKVTSSFRDPDAFDILRRKVLPQHLQKKAEGDPLRVWIPGCSSGEEAYSAAIILSECIEESNKNFAVQVFATDIDTEAIDGARTGSYPESIAADINEDRLKRNFIKKDGAFRIKKDIREMLVFAPQDIIKDPPFTKLDMICCRNLLIYQDSLPQKKLLPVFHYSLLPGGILFLGTSESIGGHVDLFKLLDKKWKMFKRRDSSVTAHSLLEFPIAPAVETEIQIKSIKPPEAVSIPHIAQQKLLPRFARPSAIINQDSEILYFHGRTGGYLEPAQGEASLNVTEMAREGLRLGLSRPSAAPYHRKRTLPLRAFG